MDFYLITGFLGAGKTTFLKQFVQCFADRKIYLVVNEFGREGVDGTLLKDLGAVMSEISNGSIFCSCRLDKFEEELDRITRAKPDVIITEASGLSDPTGIREVLTRYPSIQYKGSVCLADASNFRRIAATARVCPKQLAVSSLVLVNKTDLVSPGEILETEKQIRSLAPYARIQRTCRGAFQKEWLRFITPNLTTGEADHKKDLTLQKRDMKVSPDITLNSLKSILKILCEDAYRVKGFVLAEGRLFFADCTGPMIQVEPWQGEAPANTGHITVLAGEGMNLRRAVSTVQKMYGGLVDFTS